MSSESVFLLKMTGNNHNLENYLIEKRVVGIRSNKFLQIFSENSFV